MSAQTGSDPMSAPASNGLVDRLRFRVERLRREPNPIWLRELKQAARLQRTPVILAVLVILVTLLIASIGGVMTATSSPAQTGVVLFQTFFSVAYFVVTLVGPAVAANSIASEREGRTWEAVLLTGMRPGPVARGKFLAAYTAIGMYIVMLAPVGAMPFLFGGVTATEVVVAFVFLFLVAVVSVAFGLALSSKLASLRAAIVLTLLLACPISIFSFSMFGVGFSIGAHRLWSAVPEGAPVWLPTALERAPFDLEYVTYLVVMPIVAIAVPAWFLYEVTIANLAGATDNRSTGLKRWFLVSTLVLVIAGGVPIAVMSQPDRLKGALLGMSVLWMHLVFSVFLFQGDPIAPSRRVATRYRQNKAGRFSRFLGPGVMRSASLLTLTGVASLLALTAFDVIAGRYDETRTAQTVATAGYILPFFVFVVGLGTWLRARASSAGMARVLLFAILFGVAVGPWIVAAIAGVFTRSGSDDAFIVAAPSPYYAILMIDTLDGYQVPSRPLLMAGAGCAAAWLLLGVTLIAAAGRRCRSILREQKALFDKAERLLAEEDAATEAREAATPPATAEAAAATTEVVPAGAAVAPATPGLDVASAVSEIASDPAAR